MMDTQAEGVLEEVLGRNGLQVQNRLTWSEATRRRSPERIADRRPANVSHTGPFNKARVGLWSATQTTAQPERWFNQKSPSLETKTGQALGKVIV